MRQVRNHTRNATDGLVGLESVSRTNGLTGAQHLKENRFKVVLLMNRHVIPLDTPFYSFPFGVTTVCAAAAGGGGGGVFCAAVAAEDERVAALTSVVTVTDEAMLLGLMA